MKFQSMLLLALPSLSFSAFASAPQLSGTYISQCSWDGYPAVAQRSIHTFSDNLWAIKSVYYSDLLCLNETQDPLYENEDFSATFVIGEEIPGISYGPNGTKSYKITLKNPQGSDSEEPSEITACFCVDKGFEGRDVLYLGGFNSDAPQSTPCQIDSEAILVKQ